MTWLWGSIGLSLLLGVVYTFGYLAGDANGRIEQRLRDRRECAMTSGRHPAGKQAERSSHAANWDRQTRELASAVGFDSEAIRGFERLATECAPQCRRERSTLLGTVVCLRDLGHAGDCLP